MKCEMLHIVSAANAKKAMRVLKLDVSAPQTKDKLVIFLYTVGLVRQKQASPCLSLCASMLAPVQA
eukprot:scaffold248992_cov18-Tisochrysis_lutea.AAC.1